MTAVDTEIAIIGAGAAGIAAALTAAACGIPCRVLEARGRLGGRAWTTRTAAGLPFDYGASWIHAADRGNPFAELALAHGAGPVWDRRRRVILDGGGGGAGGAAGGGGEGGGGGGGGGRGGGPRGRGGGGGGGRAPATAVESFHASRAAAAERIEQAPTGASLAEALADHHAAPDDLWVETDRTLAGPWLAGEDNALVDAADWAAAKAGADWLLPQGYGTLVRSLGGTIPVTTGCALEAVEVSAARVRLTTTLGSFTARQALLTVPLGVLRAERIRFEPRLPAAATAAIDDLPMGCLMKVAIDLLDDPLGEHGSYYLHYPGQDARAVLYFLRPAGHAMAYAFTGGSPARALERCSDAEIREVVLAPLRQLLGQQAVERAFGQARATRWASDPLAFGSYAVARPGRHAARAVLAAPLFERLHIAGEATAPDGWHNTVGGAWLAGKAAVMRIAAAAAEPLVDRAP